MVYCRTHQHCHVLTGQRDITCYGTASNPMLYSQMHATKLHYPYCTGGAKSFVQSMTLHVGAGLLEYIMGTFCRLYYELRGIRTAVPANIDYDKQLDPPSMVQEIEALQVELDALEDEDEQRALEEDITGKILWLCWCGICAEADELLPKVGPLCRLHGGHVTCFRLRITFREKEEWSVCWRCTVLCLEYVLLSPRWTHVMIKPTCGGSCLMGEQRYRNTGCYLPLGRQNKPSGQVQRGAPSLLTTKVPLQVQVSKHPPYQWCNTHGNDPDLIMGGHGVNRKDAFDTYGLILSND
ncbi:hypothetical protein EDD15DRAFT_348979 [Pisolithus albus]|nr:hypothetical protein EDD15DRAFT_348979 [Pisolithus albus]